MKSKLDPRMEYFIFDDKFHIQNHKSLANHLKPYKIKKVKLPYENPNMPQFWYNSNKFNIFIPYGNRKYESLRN